MIFQNNYVFYSTICYDFGKAKLHFSQLGAPISNCISRKLVGFDTFYGRELNGDSFDHTLNK